MGTGVGWEKEVCREGGREGGRGEGREERIHLLMHTHIIVL